MFHNLYSHQIYSWSTIFFFYQSNNISYSNRIREISKRNYLLLPGILWKVGEKGKMKPINSSQVKRGKRDDT